MVRRDSRDGLFKCWYEDLIDHDPKDSLVEARQCYAVSEDGVTWEKPELDIVIEDGCKTNVVLGGANGVDHAHSLNVIEDPFPSDDARRFVGLFSHYPPFQGEIRAAYSPDGIHWTVDEQRPAFGTLGASMGDASMLHYDHSARCFVANCRHWHQGHPCLSPRNPIGPVNPGPRYPHDFSRQNRRRIWFSESFDLLHWSQPYLVVCPDHEEDNLDDGFYGMVYDQFGSFYVGFLSVFHRVLNEIDVQLVISRDRKQWHHVNKRQPWLTLGAPGEWDQHNIAMTSSVIEVGDELFIYYGGANCHHDYFIWGPREGMDHPEVHDRNLTQFGLGLARLRKDGFVSVSSGALREGLLVTRPFLSTGTSLVINGRCGKDGYILAEVLDHFDELMPGRSRQACDVFTGDSVSHKVTWQGESELPAARPEFGGDTVFPWKKTTPYRKLRFFLRNAELFSFRLTEA
ncbi:MAG TPA: hypothetical protein DIT01_01950 [Lentisphaeria bacterium]|nr:hypothetical protein [Lentisphaeria bacterium]